MNQIPITIKGAELLKAELQRLRSVDRPNVIQAIAEARAQGDLSENAEYDAAKERQSFIEGRIAEIEAKLQALHFIVLARRLVAHAPGALPERGHAAAFG